MKTVISCCVLSILIRIWDPGCKSAAAASCLAQSVGLGGGGVSGLGCAVAGPSDLGCCSVAAPSELGWAGAGAFGSPRRLGLASGLAGAASGGAVGGLGSGFALAGKTRSSAQK